MNIQAGKPVTGDQLIGRSAEILLINRLLDQGQSVVLVAPRRFGKTSVLKQVMNQRKERGEYTAFIDLFSIPDRIGLSAELTKSVLGNKKIQFSLHQLRHGVLELMRNIQFRQEIDQYEFILGFGQKEPDEWNLLQESLKLMESFAVKNKVKLIGFFDEFGDIGKLDGDRIVKLFRAELQGQENTCCLFAGSYESVMNKIFVTRSAPFYRFARIIRLGYIDPTIFANYLKEVFRSNDLQSIQSIADEIVGFTSGHPYYTSLFAQQVILSRFKGNLRELIEMVSEIEMNYLEKVWEDLSGNQQEKAVVLAIAGSSKVQLYHELDYRKINVSRTLKKLIGNGMIEKSDKGIFLTDPLLTWWIRENILKINQ